ncbi:MAG: SDR family oxidoreductase [Deltaproteobacteria bacterium]|nr:SDR family oxidoreductase [Deltaproteobacteria bacterium]
MPLLKNKTAFITGSSRGIGRAVALRLADEGCHILLHYRQNREEALKVEKEILGKGVRCWKYAADLSDLQQVKSLHEQIKKEHAHLDIFVSNAAATAFKPLEQIKAHHIEKTFNITISTFVLTMNAFKPLFKKGSKIITVSGIDTIKYCMNHGLLAAAKSALEMLTRYYAQEWKKEEIYVQGINPGLVDTDSMQVYWGKEYEKKKAELAQLIPPHGLMPPKDVADLILFLLSDAANWMNGETLVADAGVGFQMPVFSEI